MAERQVGWVRDGGEVGWVRDGGHVADAGSVCGAVACQQGLQASECGAQQECSRQNSMVLKQNSMVLKHNSMVLKQHGPETQQHGPETTAWS